MPFRSERGLTVREQKAFRDAAFLFGIVFEKGGVFVGGKQNPANNEAALTE